MAKHKERSAPVAGSRFARNYKGKSYTLLVVEKESQIFYKLQGKIFLSPSAAAKELTKTEVNGWKFWKID